MCKSRVYEIDSVADFETAAKRKAKKAEAEKREQIKFELTKEQLIRVKLMLEDYPEVKALQKQSAKDVKQAGIDSKKSIKWAKNSGIVVIISTIIALISLLWVVTR